MDAMTLRVRPLTPADLDDIVALHRQAFGAEKPRADLKSFLADVFFQHPWYRPERPSLGCVAPDGRLLGCIGAMLRPMVLHGEPLEVLVTHDFIVDPDFRGGLPAIQLLRHVIGTGRDPILAEANPRARQICEVLGASVVKPRSRRWIRLLRPTGFAVHMLQRWLAARGMRSTPRGGLSRVSTIPDAIARTLPSQRVRTPSAPAVEHPLDAGLLDILLREHTDGLVLRPVYTPASLGWLLDVLSRTRRDQQLRGSVVVEEGSPIGWYLYYSRKGRIGRVLQLGAVPASRALVLGHLLSDALQAGNVAVSGPTDPRWHDELVRAGCFVRAGRSSCLLYSRDPRVVSALHGPDAFFGPLEGEGWLHLGY